MSAKTQYPVSKYQSSAQRDEPPPSSGLDPSSKFAQVQKQTIELKEIMIDNIEKTIRRGEELESLENRAEQLHEASTCFYKKSKSLKWKERWNAVKFWILGVIILAIVVVIIIWISGGFNK
jgi:hypothetical protein